MTRMFMRGWEWQAGLIKLGQSFHGNGWEVAWRNHPPIELVCFSLSIAVILLLLHFIKYNDKLFGGSISLLMGDRWPQ